MSERVSVAWTRLTLDSKPAVRVMCPKCQKNHLLDHEIDDQGIVTPSLDCPTPGCDFHEMVQLVGWTPPGA